MTSISGEGCPHSPPEPPRSLAVVPLIGDKRYYGEAQGGPREAHGTVWCRAGGIGGQKSGCPSPNSAGRNPKEGRIPQAEATLGYFGFRFVFLRLHAKWLQFVTAEYAKYAESRGGRSVLPCIPRIPRLLFPSFGSGLARLGFRPSFGPRISGVGFGPLRSQVAAAVQIHPCKEGQLGQGTPNAAFWPMTILLICWAGISSVFCLAFLSVAARPAPSLDEQMALPQGLAAVLQNARTASLSVGDAVPSSCQTA